MNETTITTRERVDEMMREVFRRPREISGRGRPKEVFCTDQVKAKVASRIERFPASIGGQPQGVTGQHGDVDIEKAR